MSGDTHAHEKLRGDDTPPRNNAILIYTILSVATLFGLSFGFHSYLDASRRHARTTHLADSETSRTLDAYREQSADRLAHGAMSIDAAIAQLGRRGRLAFPQIRPEQSDDRGAMEGWTRRPREAAAYIPPPPPPPPAEVVPVPEGALIDEHGQPTTDPTTYVDTKRGALLAFGAHKGSGLAILCEVLGAAVTGGATIAPHHPRQDGIVNSMLSFILDLGAVGDPDAIKAEAAAVGDWVKASPPAPGCAEVLLPGEPERRARDRRRAEGVPIDDKSLADIAAAIASLGVAQAEIERVLGR